MKAVYYDPYLWFLLGSDLQQLQCYSCKGGLFEMTHLRNLTLMT